MGAREGTEGAQGAQGAKGVEGTEEAEGAKGTEGWCLSHALGSLRPCISAESITKRKCTVLVLAYWCQGAMGEAQVVCRSRGVGERDERM